MTEKPRLDITDRSGDVPAFTCIVYVRSDGGEVRARVANLEGIEARGSSERDVLGKVIPEFKRRVAVLLGAGDEVPWIDPPVSPNEGEQKRIVPVHL